MFKNWLFKNTAHLDKWMCCRFWTLPLISWDELKTPQPWGPESNVLESGSPPLCTLCPWEMGTSPVTGGPTKAVTWSLQGRTHLRLFIWLPVPLRQVTYVIEMEEEADRQDIDLEHPPLTSVTQAHSDCTVLHYFLWKAGWWWWIMTVQETYSVRRISESGSPNTPQIHLLALPEKYQWSIQVICYLWVILK